MVPLERLGRHVGIEEARAKLGRIVGELGPNAPILLTKRGRLVAVLVDPAHYEELSNERGQVALGRLRELALKLRERVSAAGLEERVIDEAIAAARISERRDEMSDEV